MAAIAGSRGDCEFIIRIYINVSIRVPVLDGCQSRGGADTKNTLRSSAALRLGASLRRSYLAVMAMFAHPASSATVAKSAPASSNVEIQVRRKSCGLKAVAMPAAVARSWRIQVIALSLRRHGRRRPRLLMATSSGPAACPRMTSHWRSASVEPLPAKSCRSLLPFPARTLSALVAG